MSYWAEGSFDFRSDNKEVIKAIEDAGREIFDEIQITGDVITLFHYNDSYHEDEVDNFVSTVASLGAEGDGYFTGEDGACWKYIVKDGRYSERTGTTIFTDDVEFFKKLSEKYTAEDFIGNLGVLFGEDSDYADDEDGRTLAIKEANAFFTGIYDLATKCQSR